MHERWQTMEPLTPRALLDQLYAVHGSAAGVAAPAAVRGRALWPLLAIASLIAVGLEWTLLDVGHIKLPPLQALAGYMAAGAILVASVPMIARRSLTRQRGAVVAVWGLGVLALPGYC